MKKAVIVLLIIMTISFTAAAVIAGVQLQNVETLQIRTIDVDKTREVEISKKLNNITIETDIVSDINILSTNENKIRVTLTGSYNTIMDRKVDIYLDNRGYTLGVSVKQEGLLRFFQFGDYEDDLTLNVYIPKSYNKVLEIDSFYDNLDIDEVVSDNVKINGINKYKEIRNEIYNELDFHHDEINIDR